MVITVEGIVFIGVLVFVLSFITYLRGFHKGIIEARKETLKILEEIRQKQEKTMKEA